MSISISGNCIDFDSGNTVISSTPAGISLGDKCISSESGFGFVEAWQGFQTGYYSGGQNPNAPPFQNPVTCYDNRLSFPLAADAPATDIGEMGFTSPVVLNPTGQTSPTSGYQGDFICFFKFPFANDTATGTCVGDFNLPVNGRNGVSSLTDGYALGGRCAPSPNPSRPAIDQIDKFPFSADVSATDTGELALRNYLGAAQNSDIEGYIAGGWPDGPVTTTNIMQKFLFSNESVTSCIGCLTDNRINNAGHSSFTDGYSSAGRRINPGARFCNVEKFPFAADVNSTCLGDLPANDMGGLGKGAVSGGTHAYMGGGENIESNTKFPFAQESAQGIDVGELTTCRQYLVGNQQ